MNRTRKSPPLVMLLAVLVGAGVVGCDDPPAVPLAPTASALAPSKAPVEGAQKLTIDKASSKIEFAMEAPEEKIRGRVNGASEGVLLVDLVDITKTTGLLTVDIGGIELFQTKTEGDGGKLGEETKSDLQNEHARNWLEIGPDAPKDMLATNRKVQFSITKIEGASAKNVDKMTGTERKVTFKATGDFLLHGHKTTKTAELEATFKYSGDKPVSVAVKTTRPFAVGLDENDVRPREAFGKLAAKTLEILAPKVAKEALVSLDFTASLASGGGAPPTPPAPAGSKN